MFLFKLLVFRSFLIDALTLIEDNLGGKELNLYYNPPIHKLRLFPSSFTEI